MLKTSKKYLLMIWLLAASTATTTGFLFMFRDASIYSLVTLKQEACLSLPAGKISPLENGTCQTSAYLKEWPMGGTTLTYRDGEIIKIGEDQIVTARTLGKTGWLLSKDQKLGCELFLSGILSLAALYGLRRFGRQTPPVTHG